MNVKNMIVLADTFGKKIHKMRIALISIKVTNLL